MLTHPNAAKAAEYIRMSTDAQDLSPAIQRTAIASYAGSHGLIIVESYCDAGRSGLTLHNRPAMKKLLADVIREDCPFGVVLVYDISRWGRFQDTDASAYYEYHCRLHGVDVRYVQEPFATGVGPLDALFKGIKRAMAAEYSRELKVKTIAGQDAALQKGFHMGSMPCIGVSRVAVDKHSGRERALYPMEHKGINKEHVRWVRGPDREVALVRRIFELYTTTNISVVKLADLLADEGQRARDGKPISRWRVASLLASEVFIGNFVWGRERHGVRRDESEEGFHRGEGCFEPIIPREQWEVARRKRIKRGGFFRSRERLLLELRAALQANPSLTASDLMMHGCASRSSYGKWFGSFEAALAEIGHVPHKRTREEYAEVVQDRKVGWRIANTVARVLSSKSVRCRRLAKKSGGQSVLIGGSVKLRIQPIWRRERFGVRQWSLRKVYREHFDYVLVVRLLHDNTVFDSLLLSRADYFQHDLWFGDARPADTELLTTKTSIARKFSALGPAGGTSSV